MKNIDISIIIPIYNAEQFLHRTMQSIFNQERLNEIEVEIILVNDGSKDSSGRICEEYKQRDARIRVIHQQNGGVSRARNAGIQNARGLYINFVDADDELLTHSIASLWEEVEKHPGVDIVAGQMLNGTHVIKPTEEVPDYTTSRAVIDGMNIWQLLTFSSCAKLFRTEFVKSNRLLFMPDIICGEDPLFVHQAKRVAGSVAQCRHVVYQYHQDNDNSAMHVKDRTRHYCSILKVAQILLKTTNASTIKSEADFILDYFAASRKRKVYECCDRKAVDEAAKDNYLTIRKLPLHKNHRRLTLLLHFAA